MKSLIKVIILAIFFFLIIGFLTNEVLALDINRKLPGNQVTVTAVSGLNVREGPGMAYRISRVLPIGALAEVLEESKGWLRIDDSGWIRASYTRPYTVINKIAYLTFDDGPSANNTPKILDILKQYNIKATFFVNGYGKEELYQRIMEEGHVLGNHTYSHDYKKVYSSVSNFVNEMEKLNDFLERVCGIRPTIIRFPGGSNNTVSRKYGGSKIMKRLCTAVQNEWGYQYFDWNVSAGDASMYRASKPFIVRSVLRDARFTEQAIILMHDSAPKTTTVAALPEIIGGLLDLGFQFAVLTQDTPAIQFPG